jgi:5-methylcytosine-specific restriction endonuclease McrA
MITKVCTKCGVEKPLDSFVTERRTKSGRGARCRACQYLAVKDWDRRHPEKRAEYLRRERQVRPERTRQYNRQRWARRANAGGVIRDADWRRLVDRFGGRCAYCERPATSQDHVVPLSRGGRHTIGNVVPACGSCNSSKGSLLLVEWRSRQIREAA